MLLIAYIHRNVSDHILKSSLEVSDHLSFSLDHHPNLPFWLNILQFKLDILWSLLDAISMAYEFERPPYAGLDEQAHPWHRGLDH